MRLKNELANLLREMCSKPRLAVRYLTAKRGFEPITRNRFASSFFFLTHSIFIWNKYDTGNWNSSPWTRKPCLPSDITQSITRPPMYCRRKKVGHQQKWRFRFTYSTFKSWVKFDRWTTHWRKRSVMCCHPKLWFTFYMCWITIWCVIGQCKTNRQLYGDTQKS